MKKKLYISKYLFMLEIFLRKPSNGNLSFSKKKKSHSRGIESR